jgi:hypothetical protein
MGNRTLVFGGKVGRPSNGQSKNAGPTGGHVIQRSQSVPLVRIVAVPIWLEVDPSTAPEHHFEHRSRDEYVLKAGHGSCLANHVRSIIRVQGTVCVFSQLARASGSSSSTFRATSGKPASQRQGDPVGKFGDEVWPTSGCKYDDGFF